MKARTCKRRPLAKLRTAWNQTRIPERNRRRRHFFPDIETLEERTLLASVWNAGLSPTDQFVLSATGNSGPVFSLSPQGTVTIAPTGSNLFLLDPSGNITLAGMLTTSSSRSLKDNLVVVDGRKTAKQLAELPIYRWNYISDPDGIMHLGPIAEDFYAQFGLGSDPQRLAPSDLSSIVLPVIQELAAIVERQEAQISSIVERLEEMGPEAFASVLVSAGRPSSNVESASGSTGGIRLLALDQVFNDDLIVDGSVALGFDAVNGESFGFDTLRLKENNLRIHFDDTSSSASFPANDWRIVINDSINGGANHFSIEDSTRGTIPFRIVAGASTGSLVINDDGNIGLGTDDPRLKLQLVNRDTPTVRLEQTGANGFLPQSWDFAGNETNFFVRDVTNGSRLPFRIMAGAPTNSLDIGSTGNVGIGTSAPSSSLHVAGSSGNTQLLVQEASGTATARDLVALRNNGAGSAVLTNTVTSATWRLGMGAADQFQILSASATNPGVRIATNGIVTLGATSNTFSLDASGNLTISGTLSQSSSRTVKENFAAVDAEHVLGVLQDLPIYRWNYLTDDPAVQHVGPVAEDFYQAFGLGADAQHLAVSDISGVALAGIQILSQKLRQQNLEIQYLTSLAGVSGNFLEPVPSARLLGNAGIPLLALDQVFLDDLIVNGSTAIGLDAINGENFGFDTLRLKENNLRIHFQDTSASASFPSNDWRIIINDSANGGDNHFSIEDSTGNRVPFRIEAGAPTHALVVNDRGNIGLGTNAPAVDLHMVDGDTPAIRLEQNASSGWTPQTWDVGGNDANFFVRDVTNGSRLPFRIRPGAPTSSVDIAASGNVGLGTSSPDQSLHVFRADGTAQARVEETATAVAARELLALNNNGPALLTWTNTASGTDVTWKAGLTDTDAFTFDFADTAGTEFALSPDGAWTMGPNGAPRFALNSNGNLALAGTLNQGSSITLKENLETLDAFEILRRLEALPVFTWNYTAEPDSIVHMSPMAEDFYAEFGLGTDAQHLAAADLAAANLAGLQALLAIAWYQGEQIEALTAAAGLTDWISDAPAPGIGIDPGGIVAFANLASQNPDVGSVPRPTNAELVTQSHDQAGVAVDNHDGRISNHFVGRWRDQDPSTPNVFDIWYDFRDEGIYPNLITAAQMAGAEQALEHWETASGGLLKFARNANASRADIINLGVGDLRAFGLTSAAGGNLGVGGATLFPGDDPMLTTGIAWLDVAESWDNVLDNGNPAGTLDFFTVMAHEVGHALGLGHVQNSAHLDVLSEFYQGEVPFLTADDVWQIRSLYGGSVMHGLPNASLRVLSQDQVISDDLIVDASMAVGFDAVNGENFGFDTLRLKENNLRIHFEDTSTSAFFPSNDWRIIINDSVNGGTDHFSIEDSTGQTIPFRIVAGAPNSSLVVNAKGNVGMGTNDPVTKLQLTSGNTPAIRLDQNNSDGFSPQVWDIAGNEANFFIRDSTNSSRLPFRIRPGAPTNSVTVAASGNVGIGTASPASSLHIQRNDGNAQLMVEEASSTTAARDLLVLANRGAPSIVFRNSLNLSPNGEPPIMDGDPPDFSKLFSPATIGPGSVSMLTLNISNVGSSTVVTDLEFTDNLPAGLTIATPSLVSTTCTDAEVSAPNGGTAINFRGGRLRADAACSIMVNVTSSTIGTHTNVSGDLTSSNGNSGPAAATLSVASDRPGFTKHFSPSTISVGQVSTLTFIVDNTANSSNLSQVVFADTLPSGMVVASPANASTDCEASPTLTADPGASSITFSAFGSQGFPVVGAGETCTVSVDVTATVAGLLESVTDELNSSSGGSVTSSGKAGAVLDVQRGFLTKTFIDDPIPPGGTGTLQFTITNLDRANDATAISFTDNLNAALPGLVATGLPLSDICGTGSLLSGTSSLSFSGGALPPEGSCTFSITVQVPVGAAAGTYPNTTSPVSATIGGTPTMRSAATDRLVVAPIPLLTKSFINDPVVPGGSVTLRFEITNTDATGSATDIAFSDDLSAVLPGLDATGLPMNGVCGAGSQLAFIDGSVLAFSGGSLAAGASCSFDVTLNVPTGFPGGTFTSTTSAITATLAGETLTGRSATDNLQVISSPRLRKTFTNNPVVPGGTATLEFTIELDENSTSDATAISFIDDLAAAIPGLTALGLPANKVCGAGSQLSGDSTLTFTGGNLAAGSSCTFSVTLQVPAAALPGSFTNSTSDVTATVLGQTITGRPASGQLDVAGLVLAKSFIDNPVAAGGTVDLEFTVSNQSPVASATGITFTDVLDANLPGLAAVGLPANDVCGAGSQITGGNTITFTGGNLAPGGSCTFRLTLQVPVATVAGEYHNASSAVSAMFNGTAVTVAGGTDTLTVAADVDLVVTQSAAPNPATAGGQLTYTIDLSNDGVNDAANVLVTNVIPANAPFVSAEVISGTGWGSVKPVVGGNGTVEFSKGTVSAGESAVFRIVVLVAADLPDRSVIENTVTVSTTSTESTTVNNSTTLTTSIRSLDFGDAPEPYPTLLVDNGARHGRGSLFLGQSIDGEADGQPDPQAGQGGTGGDDNNGDDDEDGVRFVASIVALNGRATTSSLIVTSSGTGKLDAWIDFNQDGDWLDANEQIAISVDVSTGQNIVSFTVPAGAKSGDTYARFRLSSVGGLAPDGLANDGEVEDYRVTILDGNAAVSATLDLIVGAVEVIADSNDIVIRRNGTELFRVPGNALASGAFLGTDGDDVVSLGNLASALSAPIPLIFDGGAGRDTLKLIGDGHSLDLTDRALNLLANLEVIDIVGTGANELKLSQSSVLAVADASHLLTIRHDNDDTVNYGTGWRVEAGRIVDSQFFHEVTQGAATLLVANKRPWQNPLNRLDVSRNGEVSPVDVAIGIVRLNNLQQGAGPLPDPGITGVLPEHYVDVSGNNEFSPVDISIVIVFGLNMGGGGESEAVVSFAIAPSFGEAETTATSQRLQFNVAVDPALADWSFAKMSRRSLYYRSSSEQAALFDRPSELMSLSAADFSPVAERRATRLNGSAVETESDTPFGEELLETLAEDRLHVQQSLRATWS